MQWSSSFLTYVGLRNNKSDNSEFGTARIFCPVNSCFSGKIIKGNINVSFQLMRKELLNICFNLYLVIALRKYANPSSVLLQSIYNLSRYREGCKQEKTEYVIQSTATLYCLRKIRIGCRSQVFFKTDVLKNFAIFAGKHLHWSLFLIKLHA